jgi:hypothetical protein
VEGECGELLVLVAFGKFDDEKDVSLKMKNG